LPYSNGVALPNFTLYGWLLKPTSNQKANSQK